MLWALVRGRIGYVRRVCSGKAWAPATKCVPKVGGRGWRWRWARRAAAVAAADNAAPVWIVRQQDANVNRYCACIYVAVLVARLWRRGRAGALGLSLDRRARGVAQGGGQLDGPPTGGVAAPFSAPSLRDGAHCASTTARGNAKTALARPSRPASCRRTDITARAVLVRAAPLSTNQWGVHAKRRLGVPL